LRSEVSEGQTRIQH